MSINALFGDGGHLTITAPAAHTIGGSAFTYGVLTQPILWGYPAEVVHWYQSNNFSYRGMYFDTNMYAYSNRTAAFGVPNMGNPPVWYYLVMTGPAGDGIARGHYCVYDGVNPMTWHHMDMDGISDYSNSDIDRLSLGDEFGTEFRGDYANIFGFTREFSDAEIEATFLRSSAGILAASPQFYVHFPEAAGLGSPFADIAGGGVETIRSGTITVTADPPNFDFQLRTGKPKTWDGASWTNHPAKVWNGSGWDTHPANGYDGSDFILAK